MQITLNNVRINYDSFGQGPVVLFISDNQHDSELWGPLAGPLIAARFRVLLVEIEQLENENEAGTAVINLLDSLGIGRAALCGLTQGKLFNRLLKDYPQRIACTYQAAHPEDKEMVLPEITENFTSLDNIEETNHKLLDYLNRFAPRRSGTDLSAMATAA